MAPHPNITYIYGAALFFFSRLLGKPLGSKELASRVIGKVLSYASIVTAYDLNMSYQTKVSSCVLHTPTDS